MDGLLSEVWASMSRNKLRVALTGFSIAFGIFMLIVLLAAGNGLLSGMHGMFGSTTNKMQMWGGWTSRSWHGHAKSRHIQLNADHFDQIIDFYDGTIDRYIPAIEQSVTMSYGHQGRSVQLTGIPEDYAQVNDITILSGRWLNALDSREQRKVVVIDKETAEVLFSDFDSDSDSDASRSQVPSSKSKFKVQSSKFKVQSSKSIIGQWVKVGELSFRVVGVYTAEGGHHFRSQESFCPFTTMAAIYSGSRQNLSTIHITLRGLETAEENDAFEKRLNRTVASVEDYDPDDRGIWIWNKAEDYLEHMKMMRGMRAFIWVIGIASLFAGIVGIGNIMLITVRERTREFGIRKAIGARPRSIVTLVLTESVAITMTFGYIGMLLGIGLSQLACHLLASAPRGDGPQVFVNPTVDMGIVIGANVIMIVAGLVAGYMPARRAAKIKPVVALAAT